MMRRTIAGHKLSELRGAALAALGRILLTDSLKCSSESFFCCPFLKHGYNVREYRVNTVIFKQTATGGLSISTVRPYTTTCLSL